MGRRAVVIGGGVMGAATAYFLVAEHGLRAVVLERDPGYRQASSTLSAGSIRQQFSTEINIRLSQASLAFYRRIGDELAVDGDRPQIGLTEPGYLLLETEAGAATLRADHDVQARCGVAVELLAPQALRTRWPWLATDDIALGALGRSTASSGEGWFDGYAVLQAFRRKASALGVRFEAAQAQAIDRRGNIAQHVACTDGRRFDCDLLVLAAGAWSAPLAAQLGFDLPVRARKRDVFFFTAPLQLPDCPLVVDPSGCWFRPEGHGYIAGAPPRGDDVDDLPLEAIDHGLFDDFIWPQLARRVPAFEAVRRGRAWAGYYEFNTFDRNGIVGGVPGCDNAFIACGFSGHGIQQAPAVGRAVAELLATGRYRSLDLSPLSPQRIIDGKPLAEGKVI